MASLTELGDDMVRSMSIGAVFSDFNGKINSIDFHRKDDLLVTASEDDSVRLYDIANAKLPMATTFSRKRKRIGDGVSLLNSNKRKETLFRKCNELIVKSDAEVSLVCVGPAGEIEVWPNHEQAKAMLTKHRENQARKKNNGKFSLESKSEEEDKKEMSANGSTLGKLSTKSLTTLLRELDSKLETIDEKIKTLSIQKATNFCDGLNDFGSFMEAYYSLNLSTNTIESYGQLPLASLVQLNQPSVDEDYSFVNNVGNKSEWVPHNTDSFALNHYWEPEIELLGSQEWMALNGCDDIGALQNDYLGSNYWNHLLQ